MNRKACALLALSVSVPAVVEAASGQPASIAYSTTDLGNGQWKYTYEVSNFSLPVPIQEFTIWFDYQACKNLQVASTTVPPGGWDEMTVQPDPIIKDNGFYDARALGPGIAAGSNQAGFAVRFDWLGTGQPGPQRFDIVDPVTFNTLYSGTTPEPASLLALVLGIILIRSSPRRSS